MAGFTSKTADPSRSLAYLMLVQRSFVSQVELWNCLPPAVRSPKRATTNPLGDLYPPLAGASMAPHNPKHYQGPKVGSHVHAGHRAPQDWHGDIQLWGPSKPHHLLLGDQNQSYRWNSVKIVLKPDAMGVSAHHRIYPSMSYFLNQLLKY